MYKKIIILCLLLILVSGCCRLPNYTDTFQCKEYCKEKNMEFSGANVCSDETSEFILCTCNSYIFEGD